MEENVNAKTKYTVLVATKGSYLQTAVEASTTFEALEALLVKMKRLHADDQEIVSVTITSKVDRRFVD